MKKLSMLFIWLFFGLSGCSNFDSLTVMTFNIRYASPNDGVNVWDNRKEMVANVFRDNSIDLAGMQEVLKHQLDYLVEKLPEYDFYGLGRDDGKEAGEYCPVLYRKDRFELLAKDSFWLSETPGKPGNLCWNTVCNRICSWVKLKDNKTGESLYFFNTHFSHVSDEARKKSADMLLKEIDRIAGDSKVILTGDFNLTRNMEAYQILVNNSNLKIYDTAVLSAYTFTQNDHSFNGWGKSEGTLIDYIFVTKNIKAIDYKIYYKRTGDIYVSDHYPVIVKLK